MGEVRQRLPTVVHSDTSLRAASRIISPLVGLPLPDYAGKRFFSFL
jgi:hypothetical protein